MNLRGPAERDRAVVEDGRALTRGVTVNALGNVSKIALPVLLAFATQAYGVERWGVFVTLQALMLVAARVGVLGLDKAMLWWVASRSAEEADRSFLPAVLLAAFGGLATAAALAGCGELALELWEIEQSALAPMRIMLIGLPLFGVIEVHLHACMGLREMAPQVFVRDTLVPLAQVLLAIALAALGLRDSGLAWSFVGANALGLGVAVLVRARVFRGRPPVDQWRLPAEFLRYALPAGLADLSNSLLQRLDTLIIAMTADAATVGVWGIVSQFSNALRQIRRAFDPIVTAVSAGIAREHDLARLTRVVSYAAQLVSVTQLPVFAFLFTFADLLLPLYGADFARGTTAVLVLAGFWLVNGASGLAGVVLSGYGHAALNLMLVWLTLIVQSGLLFALVPGFGLVGAAVAVGASYSVQNLAQAIELRRRVGAWVFSRRSLSPLRAAIASTLCAAIAGGLLGWQADWRTRGLIFGAFALPYLALTWLDWRRGDLSADRQSTSSG